MMRMSLQRQTLAFTAALAVAGALAVTGGTTDLTFGLYSLGVTVLALSAVLAHPDTSFPIVVIVLVVVRWLVSDGSPTSPATIVIAAALALFHTIAALLAGTPRAAVLPQAVLARWGIRWLAVSGATAAWWAVLALLARRDTASSTIATVAAVLTIVVGLVVVRRRALAPG